MTQQPYDVYDEQAREALLSAIQKRTYKAESSVELRVLAEAFALVTGNVAAPGVSADRFTEALRASA